MKKILRNLAFVFACLLLLTSTAFANGNIESRASSYIFGKYANIYAESNGCLKITFWVSSPAPMTELGASAIDIYENDGRSTRLIETVYATDPGYSHMMGSGTYHGSNIIYEGTVGYKYYAEVHLTASDSTGGDTVKHPSPTVTAKN